MKYLYHDLSNNQFEDLVVSMCHVLLGAGVQGFAAGRDGGRDARFEGTPNKYPNKPSSWNGITIIQAKHTNSPIAKISDNDFFDNDSSIIKEEVIKVKTLFENGELNNYFLVSNRKNTAIYNERIINYISSETGIATANIGILGIEDIERNIKFYPQIATGANIYPFDGPLIVDPDSIANVIEAICLNREDFYKNIKKLSEVDEINRTAFKKKNVVNRLSAEYADCIRPYIKDFKGIEAFLDNPDNDEYLEHYKNACEELKTGIIAHRDHYVTFDKVLDYTITMLINRDAMLKQQKKLTRTMIYYMYFRCDIGRNV